MDTLLRTYAHTAWTPANPLQGLDPQDRLAILLMPSTFRERLRMAPWTNRLQRQQAMVEILAERRLQLELATQRLDRQQQSPSATAAPQVSGPGGGEVRPYYQYRLQLHQQALEAVQATRQSEDLFELERSPAAAKDALKRAAVRRELAEIINERARLDLQELRLLEGHEIERDGAVRRGRPQRKSRRNTRER